MAVLLSGAGSLAVHEVTQKQQAQQQNQSVIAEIERVHAQQRPIERVWSEWFRGVCLVHAIVEVRGTSGEALSGPGGHPMRHENTGSGFLADVDGRVLTCRHVVKPWEAQSDLQRLPRGGQVVLVSLTATFPGRAPISIPTDSIRVRSDDLDVAVFRLPPDASAGIPRLPLHDGSIEDLADRRAILVCYPTGLSALMAKSDSKVVDALRSQSADMTTAIFRLAATDRFTPIFTQGTISTVREKLIEYDAATTHGGSGGPVFGSDGRVIAVNAAVLSGFSGSNYGVPIRFGRELLEQ